ASLYLHAALPICDWLVWTLALISIVASVIEIVRGFDETGNVVMALVPAAFAVAGALVATKQPENIVGFLMMTIGAGSAIAGLIGVYLTSFDSPPPIPVFVTLFLVLLNGWGWLYLIFPIFHMLLVFPSGKLLSPRWRWLVGLEVAMLAVFVGVTMLAREVGPTAQDEYVWVMQNPIGVFDTSTEESIFGGVWSIGLVTLALGGLAAMVIRFRRTTGSER